MEGGALESDAFEIDVLESDAFESGVFETDVAGSKLFARLFAELFDARLLISGEAVFADTPAGAVRSGAGPGW